MKLKIEIKSQKKKKNNAEKKLQNIINSIYSMFMLSMVDDRLEARVSLT